MCLLMLLCVSSVAAWAQKGTTALPMQSAIGAQPADQGEVRVSLVTIYPGNNAWSIFGHTELRVEQGELQDDYYNYGLFDFGAPNFVYRFVKGETDYMCGAIPAYAAMRDYGRRRVVCQRLNLTPEQAAQVRDLLEQNALPENATYRYKFLSDNCATRPRDIIEQVLGSSLQYHAPKDTVTYRQMIAKCAANYSWEQFGIDLALGSSIDTTITWRQQMFIPMVLMQAYSTATVKRGGTTVPLVTSTEVLNPGSEQGDVLPPTPRWHGPLAIMLLLLLVTGFVTWVDQRYCRVSRWADTALSVVLGLAGCIIAYLVLVSTHESTSPNWVLLWLNPLYLITAVMIWLPRTHGALRWFCRVDAVALLVSIIIGLTGVQHYNVAFYPIIVTILIREINYLIINRRLCSTTHK